MAQPVRAMESKISNWTHPQLRILVIDDDEFLANVIKTTLESCGHDIRIADNGLAGLEMVTEFQPQIVLVDWMMPVLDGVEVVRRIRQLPEGKFIYLMIMTQHDNESLLVSAFDAGVDDFVVKPITSRALLARISAGERLLRLEAEVERERRDSHRYLDTVDLMIVGLDIDGRITLANRKVSEFLGYSERDLLGRNWYQEFVADPAEGLTWPDYQAVVRSRDGRITPYENIIRIKDGAKRLIKWNNSVILHEGAVVGFLGCGNDITEQRQAIEEKERYSRQVLQAQKVQAIGNLVGGITHNFNNILASVMGYTELSIEIMKDKGDESIVGFLEQAHKSAIEAKNFIGTLQQIHHDDSTGDGEPTLPLLRPLLEDVARMLVPLLGPEIRIIIQVDDSVPVVHVNPNNLNQILTQLCINARDAMKKTGEITISLGHFRYLRGICASCYNFYEGEYVALSVADTGPGIEVETLESIFAPFFTTKSAVVKDEGLGLTLVHGIVHSCKGHIVVDAEPGRGATFCLLFPVQHGERGR